MLTARETEDLPTASTEGLGTIFEIEHIVHTR
jgi:hypothetical protein